MSNTEDEIIITKTIHLETDDSFLATYSFDDTDLLQKCVVDVEYKLNHNPMIKVLGKDCICHRDVAFFSNESEGYTFSGQTEASLPLTKNLKKLIKEVNFMLDSDFNGILVNRYSSGEDYIGAHSDNERGLGNVGVACLSYGASRTLRIKDRFGDKKTVLNLKTNDKELILMGGDFQKEFTHQIPIEKKVKGVRISFTFRSHKI